MMHPNKAPFIGILTIVDEPSDKAPAGARGHRVIMSRAAAEDALSSLIGMGISFREDMEGHSPAHKVGVIESAEIVGNEIQVVGFLWCRDIPKPVRMIQASSDPLGMSYELAEAHVEDMRAEVWEISRFHFTGAAVLSRNKAAYLKTEFCLL